MKKLAEFNYEMTAYLSDSNAVGNVYFAKYIEWQGKAREYAFRELVGTKGLEIMSKYKMITCEVGHKYKNQVLPFEDVVIKVTFEVEKLSLYLRFEFRLKESNILVGTGFQKCAFLDYETNKFVAFEKLLGA